jgi:hypoxanthine phosphoribosyltransferase
VISTERLVSDALDVLGIEWVYEPREFELPTKANGKKQNFRPDFYLPELDTYIEVTTQRDMNRKNRKVRLLRERYPDVTIHLMRRTDLEQPRAYLRRVLEI